MKRLFVLSIHEPKLSSRQPAARGFLHHIWDPTEPHEQQEAALSYAQQEKE